MEWYCAIDDQQLGPVREAELYRLARSGRLSPDDLIWNPSMGDRWAPASSFPDLFSRTPAAAPGPPSPPSAHHLSGPLPPPSTGGWAPNGDITGRARESLDGNWGLAIGVTLIHGLIVNLGPNIVPVFGPILILVINGPLSLGLATFFLHLARRRPTSLEQLFEGFQWFGNALGAYLLMAVFVFCWSLLLVIPGIIALLAYAMTYYVMADQPGIGPLDAISRSKEMMRGHKWQFFCLGFRFLGWTLLAVFLTFGIGMLWVIPYMHTAYAQFYEMVRGEQRTL